MQACVLVHAGVQQTCGSSHANPASPVLWDRLQLLLAGPCLRVVRRELISPRVVCLPLSLALMLPCQGIYAIIW